MNLIKNKKHQKTSSIISLTNLKKLDLTEIKQTKTKSKQSTFGLKFIYNFLAILIFLTLILQLELATQSTIHAQKFGLGISYEKIKTLNDSFSGNVPQTTNSINMSNFNGDKRVVALYIFLSKYNSPMATPKIAKAFVEHAENNGFGDKWYILPAISGIESAFGRLIPVSPQGKLSYNAWGWSGGSRYGRWSFFDSWEDAVEKVSAGFSTIYKDTDFVPERMVARYCPPCALPESRGVWPRVVNQYSKEILEIYNSI